MVYVRADTELQMACCTACSNHGHIHTSTHKQYMYMWTSFILVLCARAHQLFNCIITDFTSRLWLVISGENAAVG